MDVKKTKKESLKSYEVKSNFTYKGKDYRIKDKIKLNINQAKAAKKQNLI